GRSLRYPGGATTPAGLELAAGPGREIYPQPPADRSWTSSAEPGSAARPAERTGTRRQGAAEVALAWPQHAPIHVTPVVVFCGILWRRRHNPIAVRLFRPCAWVSSALGAWAAGSRHDTRRLLCVVAR